MSSEGEGSGIKASSSNGEGKPIRRRSRASKKAPARLLNANPKNFRSLVQQFTGFQSSPNYPFGDFRGPINLNFAQHSYSSSCYTADDEIWTPGETYVLQEHHDQQYQESDPHHTLSFSSSSISASLIGSATTTTASSSSTITTAAVHVNPPADPLMKEFAASTNIGTEHNSLDDIVDDQNPTIVLPHDDVPTASTAAADDLTTLEDFHLDDFFPALPYPDDLPGYSFDCFNYPSPFPADDDYDDNHNNSAFPPAGTGSDGFWGY